MHERNRYRITGSIFLIALAIILLPMLFDGAGVPVDEAPRMPQGLPDNTSLPEVPRFDEIVPASNVVDQVQELKDQVDADGFSTDDGTRVGEPRLGPANTETKIWAVQAASFAGLSNAKALRTQLREAGYEAFISSTKTAGGKVLHRVAVGPLLKKDDAQDIRRRVSTGFSLQPDIVSMTP